MECAEQETLTMPSAAAEWELIRDAFRTRDEAALINLATGDGRRRRLARLLVKYDFLPGCACAEMHLDRQLSLEESAKVIDYLRSIE